MLVAAAGQTTNGDAAVYAAMAAVLAAAILAAFAFLIKAWIQAPINALTHEMREYNQRLAALEAWRIVHIERVHGTRKDDTP